MEFKIKDTVKKYKHRCKLRFAPIFLPFIYGKEFVYKVTIEDDIYDIPAKCTVNDLDLNNQYEEQVNKLFGFSIGHHHKNSFRIGFRRHKLRYENAYELVYYSYFNGVREAITETFGRGQEVPFLTGYPLYINIKTNYNIMGAYLDIKVTASSELFVYNGLEVRFTGIKWYHFWGYKLFPYIGGSIPTMKDCTIKIESI